MEIQVNKQLYIECKKYLPSYWIPLLFEAKQSDMIDNKSSTVSYHLQLLTVGADSFKYNLGDELKRKYSTSKYNLIRLTYIFPVILILVLYNQPMLYMLITLSVSLILLSELNIIHLKQYINQKHMYANSLIKELIAIGIIAHQSNLIDNQAKAIDGYVKLIDNVNRTSVNLQARYTRLCELTAYEDMDVIREHMREVNEMEGVDRKIYTIISESIN